MDHTSQSPSTGAASAAVPRTATRKPISARISQIEAKIQSAGGQVVPAEGRGAAGIDVTATVARDAQYELFRGCNDVEKLRAMALSVLKELEEARMENQDLTQSLRYTRSQLAESKLRAESAEATASEMEGKVQNLGVRLEQLQKSSGTPIVASPSNPDIPKSSYLKRMPSTSSRASQIGPFNSSPSETPPPRYSTPSLGDLLTPIGTSIQQATKSSSAATGNVSPKRAKSPAISNPSSTPEMTPLVSSSDSTASESRPTPSKPSSSQHTPTSASLDTNTTGDTVISSDGPSSSETDVSAPKSDTNGNKEPKSKDKRGKKPKEKANRDTKISSHHRAPSPRSVLLGASTGDEADQGTESGDSPTPRRIKGVVDEEEPNLALASEAIGEADKRRSNPFKRSSKSSPAPGEEEGLLEGEMSDQASLASAGVESGAKGVSGSPPVSPKTRKDRSMSEASSSSQGKQSGRNYEKSGRGVVDDGGDVLQAVGSSASVVSTASAGNASEEKLMRRTSASSISSASGDYSSYGSAVNVGAKAKKLKSEKSLGKHYERTISSAATPMVRPSKIKVASEDIQTDVELNKSAVARNYRRGMSGDLESAGVVMSIVDPTTMGSGKRRNSPSTGLGSPSNGGSPIQVMSGSPQNPHNPRNLVHLHANSVGNNIGPRTFARRPADSASATDHEGEYHTETTEAKFRALERKRERQLQKDALAGTKFGVAFGVRRGSCEPPCECDCYYKTVESYACEGCGHFPAQHVDLGKISDDEDELNLASSHAASASSAGQPQRRPSSHLIDATTDPSNTQEDGEIGFSTKGSFGPHKRSSDSLSSSSTLVSTTNGLDDAPVIDAHWLLNFSDCYFINQLGKGNSSTVFLGEYQGQQVAIKVLRQETHKRDLDDFKKEMEIMCSLRSPYIVHFFGATVQPKLCIVLEYCPRGTLFHYLHDDLNYVDWTMAMRWLLESARGINTLHLWKPQIVHRDLKTLNLLLDEKMQVKVCDFGLSRYVSGEHDQSTFFKMRGTFAYFAPEVYQGRPFTSKSDVYSFGIILWEIVHRIIFGTHTRPFAEFKHINHDFQIIIQAAKGLRPTLPFSTPRILVKLYEDCVASDPDARPTCAEIIDRLDEIVAFYDQHTDTWDALVKGGVRIRPTLASLRRDSQASPSRGSRAELLRTPIASRNLKDDLTRRGVTATLLREKSLSASSGGYGTDTASGLGSSSIFTERLNRSSMQLSSSTLLSSSSSSNTPLPSPNPSSRISSGDKDPSTSSSTINPPTNTDRDTENQVSSESPSLTASSNSLVSTGGGPPSNPHAPSNDHHGTTPNDTDNTQTTSANPPVASPPSPSPIEKKPRSASAAPTPNSPSSSPKRNGSPSNTKRKKKVFDAPSVSLPTATTSNTTDPNDPTPDDGTTDTDAVSARDRTPSPSASPPASTATSPTSTPTKKKRTPKVTSQVKSEDSGTDSD